MEIPPVEPHWNEDSKQWEYYPGDYPRRGGFKVTFSIVKQKTYPAIGYAMDEGSKVNADYTGILYTKAEVADMQNDERDIGKISDKKMVLNKSCLINALAIDESSTPTKREDRSIEVLIEKAHPSDLVMGRIKRVVEKCPFIIKRIELDREGLLTLKGVLRKQEAK
jgi:hypothetical protein